MRIYSFDVFDTCLVRKCGTPDNLFDILARRAFSEEVDEKYYEAFVIERKRAESEKWSKSKTLSDIYKEFYLPLEHIYSNQELENIELECETELLSPVFSVKQRIDKYRKKGHRIVYISDMYLSESFIKEQLIKHGLYQQGDALFVSSSHNAAKFDGSLYKLVHAELGISYHSWHHFGDNRHSDVKVPRILGIRATRIKNGYSPYQKTTKDIICKGFNWSGIAAGLSRSMILSEEYHPHKLLYIDLILPFFTTFTYKILKRASQDGINRLYFCARDAYPLYQIALQFQPHFPKVDIQLLSISTLALYEGNQHNALLYFRKIGLANYENEDVKCGIVDIRTSGKTLVYLNNLFNQNGYKSVYGYFWEITKPTSPINNNFIFSEINDSYIRNRKSVNCLAGNWILYELFFPLNTLKRTINYLPDGSPEYEENRSCELNISGIAKWVKWRDVVMHQYLGTFQYMGMSSFSEKLLENSITKNLVDFLNEPHYLYVAAREGITINLDVNKNIPFVKKSPIFLFSIMRRNTVWRRGTIAFNMPTILFRTLRHIKEHLSN